MVPSARHVVHDPVLQTFEQHWPGDEQEPPPGLQPETQVLFTVLQFSPEGHAQVPPQPSGPQLPAGQFGAQGTHWDDALQVSPLGQRQVPPQPLAPQ